MIIYVDAMGGDLAPEAPVKGALKALRQYPHLTIILAGKLDEVKPFLGDYEDVKDRLILEEEPEVITNHESPVMGVRKKVNSATVQGMLKVRNGEADGFVSAGSTGAKKAPYTRLYPVHPRPQTTTATVRPTSRGRSTRQSPEYQKKPYSRSSRTLRYVTLFSSFKPLPLNAGNSHLHIGRFGHDFKDIGQRLLQAHFRQEILTDLRF